MVCVLFLCLCTRFQPKGLGSLITKVVSSSKLGGVDILEINF